MDELNAVATVLNDKFHKIVANKNFSYNEKLGRIGEAFVKTGIKQCMFDMGYSVGRRGKKTFTIRSHYKSNENKSHKSKSDESKVRGIDFFLKFRDDYYRTYRFFIEVKNWKHMKGGISPDMFKRDFLSRFRKDLFKSCFWVVAINYRNKPYIEKMCEEYDIHIVPLRNHITSNFSHIKFLRTDLEYFTWHFSQFINDILRGKIKRLPFIRRCRIWIKTLQRIK